MGRVFSSLVKRPAKNWNVENRAHKVLDQQKPIPAPKHASTTEALDKFEKEHPDFLQAQKEKNEYLHDMLKGVTVNPDRMGQIVAARKLPENRSAMPSYEFGFPVPDPSKIPAGRVSISQAMAMIRDHHLDPTKKTAAVLANEYNMESPQVKTILEHFHTFMLQVPTKDKASLTSGEVSAASAKPDIKVLEDKDSKPS